MKESKITKYTATFIHGVDDMESLSPWFTPDGGWPYWSPAFSDVTKESYAANEKAYVARVIEYNDNLTKELTDKGLIGKPYTVDIHMVHNSLFDDPKITTSKPISSYRMIFLDNN